MNTLFVIVCTVLIIGSRIVEHYQATRSRAYWDEKQARYDRI